MYATILKYQTSYNLDHDPFTEAGCHDIVWGIRKLRNLKKNFLKTDHTNECQGALSNGTIPNRFYSPHALVSTTWHKRDFPCRESVQLNFKVPNYMVMLVTPKPGVSTVIL